MKKTITIGIIAIILMTTIATAIPENYTKINKTNKIN